MKLEKTLNECTVKILYNSDDPPIFEEEEKKDDKSQQFKEFTIIIEYKNGHGLVFDCVAVDNVIDIIKLCYFDDVKNSMQINSMEKAVSMGQTYTGRQFETLPENVQDSLLKFVESLGIDKKVLSYREKSAKDQEQILYQNWLHEMKKFTKEYK